MTFLFLSNIEECKYTYEQRKDKYKKFCMSRMSFMCASTIVLGERREGRKSARKSLHDVVSVVGRSFFSPLSVRHLCLRVIIFFKTSNGDEHAYSREQTRTKEEKEREGGEKERSVETYFIHQQHLARRKI